MNKYLIILLLAILTQSSFIIHLKKSAISYPEQSHKPDQESAYTFQALWGSQTTPITTLLDITASQSWQFTSSCVGCLDPKDIPYQCNAPCALTEKTAAEMIAPLGGRIVFSSNPGTIFGFNNVKFENRLFKQIPVLFPQQLDKASGKFADINKHLLAKAAIGLGPKYDGQIGFIEAVSSQLKLESPTISLYLNGNIAQAILGKPENFFSNGQVFKFKNQYRVPDSEEISNELASVFALKSTLLIVGANNEKIAVQTNTHKYANVIFDSTTKYILCPKETFNKIINLIQAEGITCIDEDDRKVCRGISDIHRFPVLKFQLFGEDDKKTIDIDLVPNSYIEEYSDKDEQQNDRKNFVLLIKEDLNGWENQNLAPFVYFDFWFGEPFFKNYYASFNQKENTISISKAYKFESQPIHINIYYRNIFVILGILIALFSIAILLTILHKVPYNDSMKPAIKEKPIEVIKTIEQPKPFQLQQILQSQPVLISPTNQVYLEKIPLSPNYKVTQPVQIYPQAIYPQQPFQQIQSRYVPVQNQ